MQQLFFYIAAGSVLCGIAAAVIIAADLRRRPQPMAVMNTVWILTALWASVFALAAYYAFGRAKPGALEVSGGMCRTDDSMQDDPEMRHLHSRRPEMKMSGMDMSAEAGMKADGMSEMTMPGDKPMKGMDMPAGAEMKTDGMSGMTMPGDKPIKGMDMSAGAQMKTGGMSKMMMPGDKPIKGMDMPAGAEMKTDGMSGMMMPGDKPIKGMDMSAGAEMKTGGMPGMKMPERPKWQSVVLSTLHCGAGCTLADLIGEWFLYFVPVAIGGSLIAGSWTVDFLLALAIGIGFQYAAIRSMEPSRPKGEIVVRAAKADFLSLTAWQIGMYAWMAFVIFGLNAGEAPSRTGFTFWFMMQIAMGCGFIVALPMNVLLIKLGIKKGMS